MESYLGAPLERHTINVYEKVYPCLSELAKIYLSIPGATVGVERVVAKAILIRSDIQLWTVLQVAVVAVVQ
jgi:hypothetical protein